MPPQPHKVELDLDRKEELIIAKQLRACRVNIMPKVMLYFCFDNSTKQKSDFRMLTTATS